MEGKRRNLLSTFLGNVKKLGARKKLGVTKRNISFEIFAQVSRFQFEAFELISSVGALSKGS